MKPHIYKANGVWWCGSIGKYWTQVDGMTPKEAYSWWFYSVKPGRLNDKTAISVTEGDGNGRKA